MEVRKKEGLPQQYEGRRGSSKEENKA